MNSIEILQEKVSTLQAKLLAADPTMPVMLKEIHKLLKEYPECVTILSDEEVGIIVSGLQKQTNTMILQLVAKKGTGKSLKKTTLADL